MIALPSLVKTGSSGSLRLCALVSQYCLHSPTLQLERALWRILKTGPHDDAFCLLVEERPQRPINPEAKVEKLDAMGQRQQ